MQWIFKALEAADGCTWKLKAKMYSGLQCFRTHLGYIPFEGRIGKKLSNVEKFYIEAKRANLQPVKKVGNLGLGGGQRNGIERVT